MTEPVTPAPSAAGGDPTKSDDHDTPGLRSDLGGTAADASVTSPTPGGDAPVGSAPGGQNRAAGESADDVAADSRRASNDGAAPVDDVSG